METGDSLTDGQGTTWTVGQQLGRGMWGVSWLVRNEHGVERVLKVPLGRDDFPADSPVPDSLIEACEACARQQADLLSQGELPFLPRLEDRFTTAEGRTAMLTPRYSASLASKISGAAPLGEVVRLVLEAAKQLDATKVRHGNLRPTNILLNDRGEPVLTDLFTDAAFEVWSRLADLHGHRRSYLPPEAGRSPTPGWDAWAVCAMLYEAALTDTAVEDPRAGSTPLPTAGLDKVQVAALKDKALARLKQERANPRFSGKVADRLGAVLNRGLSEQPEPSPPYRFHDLAALQPRLAEIAALLHPHVETVGRVLPAAHAETGVFEGGRDVEFSVTVGCSDGVTAHEDLVCGVNVRDLDADGDGRIPVPDCRYTVTTHPSGRFRFDFVLPDLPPGRYAARIAFLIKDSGDDPLVAAGDFEVRPPPGYVPPAEEPPPQPVPLPVTRKEPTPSVADENVPSGPGADIFPMPIAPSAPGTSPGTSRPTEEPVRAVAAAVSAPVDTLESSPGPVAVPVAPSSPDALRAEASPSAGPAVVAPVATGPAPISTPSPAISVPPPTGAAPAASPVADAPRSDWSGPGQWEQLPGPEDSFFDPAAADSMLPTPEQGEDLPTYDSPGSTSTGLPPWLEQLVTFVKRDTYTALMAGVGALLVALVVLLVVLNLLFF